MNEFIKALIERLEKNGQKMSEAKTITPFGKHSSGNHRYYKAISVKKAKFVVKELAEEYKGKYVSKDEVGYMLDTIEMRGDETWMDYYHKALKGLCALNDGEYNNDWIPCSERLPEDYDNRFYMCIVENHEEDLPMFCQYDENYGFGFWHDIYDEHSLGFVDSEFKTNEELGYEKVIAWQQRPAPYQPKGE